MVRRSPDVRYILPIMFMITDPLSFKGLSLSSMTTPPHSLAARVFQEECEAYPEAIRLFAAGQLKIEGRKVTNTQTIG